MWAKEVLQRPRTFFCCDLAKSAMPAIAPTASRAGSTRDDDPKGPLPPGDPPPPPPPTTGGNPLPPTTPPLVARSSSVASADGYWFLESYVKEECDPLRGLAARWRVGRPTGWVLCDARVDCIMNEGKELRKSSFQSRWTRVITWVINPGGGGQAARRRRAGRRRAGRRRRDVRQVRLQRHTLGTVHLLAVRKAPYLHVVPSVACADEVPGGGRTSFFERIRICIDNLRGLQDKPPAPAASSAVDNPAGSTYRGPQASGGRQQPPSCGLDETNIMLTSVIMLSMTVLFSLLILYNAYFSIAEPSSTSHRRRTSPAKS